MQIKKIKKENLIKEIKKIKKLKKARLVTITVLEDKSKFIILYHFDAKKRLFNLKLELPKKNKKKLALSVLDSIIKIFPSANIYECEIHDLFGIEFKGNPNLEHKLFLADDWKEGPPLRRK